MLRLIVAGFLILQLQVQAKEYYSIIGPGTIRPNSNYSIVVTVHDLKQACKIKLGIEGPQFDKKTEVTVQPISVEKVDLWIPDIVNGVYSLIAEGISGLNFKNRTILNFMDAHSPTIYVQTDKAMYKPGDLLQFRVIVLDENLKPAVIKKPIMINVENSKNMRIKQFSNITLTKGVFKEQMQLSEFTKTGNWHISVQINGEAVKNKTFVVEKYVLPKFLIEIDAPKQIGITENYLRFTVRSKYTYGKPVKGTANINIFKSFTMTNLYNVTKDVQGEKEITINFDSILPNGLPNNFKETLKIEVKMEDYLTGIKRNATVEVDVMQHPTFIKTPKTLADCESPDDMFEYPISVTNLDNENVVDTKNKKKIHIIQRDDKNGEQISIKPLNGKGETSVLMKCSTAQTINFEIEYEGNKVYRELSRPNFVDEDKVGVHVKTRNPNIGKPINVHLRSDVPYTDFIYVITAGGNIVASDIVNTDDDETQSYIFQITPTFEMMPEAYIYVHFVEHNNYRFYETSFKLPLQFQNKLTIRAPKQTVPAEEIPLKIKTDTDSYVGLLAVDKSVLLLKAGNDLNANEILEGYRSFTSQNPEIYLDTKYPYPGEESGLVTLTNAHFKFTFDKESEEKIEPKIFKRSSVPPRVYFPETWFFDDFESSDKMGLALNKTMPDTITTWVVTGFSLNSDTGFTLTNAPVEIKTFIPFFITTNLPYSIKLGEIISIPVVVYNYMKDNLQVMINLHRNDAEFELLVDEAQNPDDLVPPNGGLVVNFLIRPLLIGSITLKFTASSMLGSDTIHRQLKVEPEGLTQFKNNAFHIKADETIKVQIEIPKDIISDSLYIDVAATQYVLGSMISTIENPDIYGSLIRMPSGCGEQNMINFVPNVMVLDYLKSIDKKSSIVESNARNHLTTGYQNQLKYRNYDTGAFGTFTYSQGNTWLTAYVLRSFQQASKYIFITTEIYDKGFTFLSKKQQFDGHFAENGSLICFKYISKLALTSFVLLAFLEDKRVADKYSNVINLGYQYLENNINNTDDMYSYAIAAYALQKRKPNVVKALLPRIESYAHTDKQFKWWNKSTNSIIGGSGDIEVTSYMLMTLLDMNETVEPIVNWLISKRNSNGGFGSTQETVVGLQALTKFSLKNTVANSNLVINVSDTSNSVTQGSLTVNDNNNLKLQQLELNNNIRGLEFKAKGMGTAVLQVSYRYNTLKDVEDEGFKIDVKPMEEGSKLYMLINFELNALAIDIRFGELQSNMVLMEVHLPTGYAADVEDLRDIQTIADVDHVELQNADTNINIYFKGLEAFKKIQIPIRAVRVHAIAELRPSPIIVYDYYDTEKRGTHYYKISSSLCDICVDEECSTECEN